MIDYAPLIDRLAQSAASRWIPDLQKNIQTAFSAKRHGTYNLYKKNLARLPLSPTNGYTIEHGAVTAGDISGQPSEEIRTLLKEFHPWRKGPYTLFGIPVTTEWRSDLKWDRISSHLSSLKDRLVLDIGCGNGYHCWRMHHEGAAWVVGVEPYLLSVMQFWVVKRCVGPAPVYVVPSTLEQIPQNLQAFDTVFSMGVLYHARSPLDHLMKIKSLLKPGGECIIETLVVDGNEGYSLVPMDRYAKMRNVWFIPTPLTLKRWLRRCGFKHIKLIDITKTTKEEQRKTEWMQFESLEDFLDPDNSALTIEGYPAPTRAIYICST